MATTTVTRRPSVEQVWEWLAEVPDPEIPVISVVDLGIVRDVRWEDQGELVVAVTPTYSGCPATAMISLMIEDAMRERGLDKVRLERRIAPPWTTDWITENPLQAATTGVSMAIGAGLGVVFTGISSHWLFNSALPAWSVEKLGEQFNEYLKSQEDLIQKGELTKAEAERAEFERAVVKTVGAPLLGSFAFASGAVMMTAGLIQQANSQAINGVPGLLNLPVLGALFRSRDYQRKETELMIMVTPLIAKPMSPAQVARPDDGFIDSHDGQAILLGRLNRLYGLAPVRPVQVRANTKFGFITD